MERRSTGNTRKWMWVLLDCQTIFRILRVKFYTFALTATVSGSIGKFCFSNILHMVRFISVERLQKTTAERWSLESWGRSIFQKHNVNVPQILGSFEGQTSWNGTVGQAEALNRTWCLQCTRKTLIPNSKLIVERREGAGRPRSIAHQFCQSFLKHLDHPSWLGAHLSCYVTCPYSFRRKFSV